MTFSIKNKFFYIISFYEDFCNYYQRAATLDDHIPSHSAIPFPERTIVLLPVNESPL